MVSFYPYSPLNATFLLVCATALLHPNYGYSQGAIDGYMKGIGITDVALTASIETYNQYYFGTELQNISNTVQSLNLFVEHAFSDSLDLVFTLPYLRNLDGEQGFQDAILALKYRNQRLHYKNGAAGSLITAVGVSFPTHSYSTEVERPLGERALVLQARLLYQHEWSTGYFLQVQSGYDLRVAPILQNAIPVILRGGWAGARFYVDGWIDYYHTFNAGANDQIAGGQGSKWWRAGGTAYKPLSTTWGVFVGGAIFLSGENIGLASRINLGVVRKLGTKKTR